MKIPALGSGDSLKLFLVLSILTAGASFLGATVANSNSLTENPSSFVAGTLVLSNAVAGDLPCTPVAASLKCVRLLGANVGPGQVLTTSVTLQNVGTVPVGNLAFFIGDCQSTNNPSLGFHGTADLCPATQVTLHDDVHDQCYYPAHVPGACNFVPGSTVTDLASRFTRAAPLALSPDHLGGGITFTLTMRIDSLSGNDLQGRQAIIDMVWQAIQV